MYMFKYFLIYIFLIYLLIYTLVYLFINYLFVCLFVCLYVRRYSNKLLFIFSVDQKHTELYNHKCKNLSKVSSSHGNQELVGYSSALLFSGYSTVNFKNDSVCKSMRYFRYTK